VTAATPGSDDVPTGNLWLDNKSRLTAQSSTKRDD